MGNYFSQFHKVLCPYISIKGKRSIAGIYNQIFSWAIPDDKQVDFSKLDMLHYAGPQVARWTSAKEELPAVILEQASNNVAAAVETYAFNFYEIIYKVLILSGQSIENLDSTMKHFLDGLPITFFDTDTEPEGNNKYYPASRALVTALIYDRVKKDSSSGKDRLIAPDLYMALSVIFAECQKNNTSFATPFILDLLLQEAYSPLLFALDLICVGMGEKWRDQVHEYVKNGPHKPFAEMRLGENELIFLAKILAIRENYVDTHSSCIASRETICCTFPLCQRSITIAELWSEISSHGIDQELWEQIVKYSHRKLNSSTMPHIFPVTEEIRERSMAEIQKDMNLYQGDRKN